ncbi:hypothetical protein ACFL2M_00650 [Patescibacteria group bacterium]
METYTDLTAEELSEHFVIAAKENDVKKAIKVTAEETIEKSSDKAADKTKENETVADVGDQVNDAFLGLDLANPSWDMFVLLFFVVASLLYGISLGRDRIIVILVSIYMALAVVEALPDFVLNISLNENFAFQITTFISVFVVLFFLISRSAILRTLGANSSRGKWYQTIVFSVLHVGLLLSIAMSFLPPSMLDKFAPLTQTIFTHEWAIFSWIAAPIVAMVLFGSKAEE